MSNQVMTTIGIDHQWCVTLIMPKPRRAKYCSRAIKLMPNFQVKYIHWYPDRKNTSTHVETISEELWNKYMDYLLEPTTIPLGMHPLDFNATNKEW